MGGENDKRYNLVIVAGPTGSWTGKRSRSGPAGGMLVSERTIGERKLRELAGGAPRERENAMSSGTARYLKEAGFGLVSAAQISRLWRYRNRRKLLILMYHAVVADNRPYELWTHVHVQRFREQIQFLNKHYQVLPLSEIMRRINNGESLPDYTAAVTFDDGFENNYTHAYPVLAEEQVPATIFLATGFLDSQTFNWPDRLYLLILGSGHKQLDLTDQGFGVFDLDSADARSRTFSDLLAVLKSCEEQSKNDLLGAIDARLGPLGALTQSYWHDFAPMSWENAREMQASGFVEFGAHTVNHEILSRLSPEKMEQEIVASCERITEMLGISQPLFAYPNGALSDFDDGARRILQRLGLPCALTTVDRLCDKEDDRYMLPRIGIGADMSMSRFELASSGLLSSCKRLLDR